MRLTAKLMIINHEGFRSKPYRDTVGKLTIGFGRNLEDKGISYEEALFLLGNDITECEDDLKVIFGEQWKDLPVPIQAVLIDMRYNLGPRGFRSFRKMIQAVKEGRWRGMINEMYDSKWAKQVPARVQDLINVIKRFIDGKE